MHVLRLGPNSCNIKVEDVTLAIGYNASLLEQNVGNIIIT